MIWEALQGIGALVGLVTGAFVFYEHLTRHSPVAYVIAKPLVAGGSGRVLFLRVENPSVWPIFIRWPSGITKNEFRIGRDSSTRGVIEALIDGKRVGVVDGKSVRDFVLLLPNNFDGMSMDGMIETAVRWRFAQTRLWKPDRKMHVRMTKEDVVFLQDERPNLDFES